MTPAETAEHHARRKRIYLKLHPETAPVTVRGGPGRGKTTVKLTAVSHAEQSVPSFAADTAAKTGMSESTVKRAVRRGERIAPDVLHAVIGTPLDTGKVLDALSKMTPDEQKGRGRGRGVAEGRAVLETRSAAAYHDRLGTGPTGRSGQTRVSNERRP